MARSWIGAVALALSMCPAVAAQQQPQQTGADLRTAARNPAPKTELAAALLSAGKTVEAIETFREVLATAPNYEPALLGLGDCLRSIHNFDEARALYQRAAHAHPKSALPARSLGSLEIELQNYDAAIAALKKSLALDSGGISARADLAAAYAAKGDLKMAVAEADHVIARDPKHALAYFVRGSAYADQNETAKAYADAEKLLVLAPNNSKARMLLAKEAVKLSKCSRAVEVLQPLDGPDEGSEALFQLGRAHQCAGNAPEAEAAMARYKQVSEREQQAAEDEIQSTHLTRQAEDEAQANHLQPAQELVNQALEKNPRNGDAHALLAKLRFSTGQTADARQSIDQALSLDPNRSEYLYVLGKIQQHDGELAPALATLRRVTALNPRESDAYYEMGLIYRQQGDAPRAVESLKQAVAIAPDDPDYRRALAEATPDAKPN